MAFTLLLALVFLTAAFYRDFSHIGVSTGSVKVYVTELAISAILAFLMLEALRTGIVHLRFAPSAPFVLFFLFWGVVSFYRGRTGGLLSLREAATNYYSLFYLMVALVAHTPERLRVLVKAILAGAVLASILVLYRVVTGEGGLDPSGSLRFKSSVAVCGAATFFFLAAPAATSRKRLLLTFGALISVLVSVVATLHRSAAISMGGASLAWMWWFHAGRGKGSIGSRKAIAIGLVVAALLVAAAPHFGNGAAQRLFSVGVEREDANTKWRLFLWQRLASELMTSPFIGFGFGNNYPMFEFRGRIYGLDPEAVVGVHNSYLFVLYKEGLVGLLALVAFIASVIYRCTRSLGYEQQSQSTWIVSASLGAFVFIGIFAAFNVVLEGPYMGMLFWLFAGIAEVASIAGEGRPNSLR